jgi:hypothetical protein
MIRGLYRGLVRLHPHAFRVRFAQEMFAIFDEAESTWGPAFLLGDATASLARQWLTNWNVWRWLAASGAGILLLAIAFGSYLPWDKPMSR